MKLTTVLLTAAFLQVNANSASQSISFSGREVPLTQIFQEVKKQTGLLFFYDRSILDGAKPVTIKAINQPLIDFLDEVFKDQPLKFSIQSKTITVSAKPPTLTLNPEAPPIDVSGRVTNEKEEPLVGVSIKIKGSDKGTTTNGNGEFSINIPENSSKILIFSFVGMVTEEVNVSKKTLVNISLKNAVIQQQEVVVTALGITKEKRTVGFSTQELAKKDLTDARDVNVGNYLTGKIAGVQVSLSGSGVGGSSKVIIRGFSSLTGENQPLYVVDGVPLDNSHYTESSDKQNTFSVHDFGDGIGNINPQDIESINVLKGPSATSLYGSRGSNGVIVITTKSGKGGKVVAVEVNSNVTIDKVNLIPKFQNKYMTGYNDNYISDNLVNVNGVDYPDVPTWHWESMGPQMKGQLVINPFVLDPNAPPTLFKVLPQPENNVKDFYQTGVVTNNSVAVSGGSEKSTVRLSVNNTTIKGIMPNHKENQQSITLRAGTKVTDRLSFDGKVNYIHKNADNVPTLGTSFYESIPANLISMGRYVPLPFLKEYYEKTGEGGYWPGLFFNPYYALNEFKNNAERDRIISFASLKYQFSEWLSLIARSGIDQYSERRRKIYPVGAPGFDAGKLIDETYFTKESNSEVLLTASKDNLGKNFSASLTLGASLLKRTNRLQGWDASDLKVPGIYDVTNARNVIPTYTLVKREMQSAYFSGEIGYKHYLFLDVTGRNDWSSVLGKNNYSFFYPSVSSSFIFTDAFNLKSKVLTFGKVRASYALAGNDGANYLTTAGYFLNSTAFNGQSLAYQSNTIPLFDLKNELKKSVEFGLDLKFFGDRLGLDATYYKSNTKNQILPITISGASGYTTKIVNAGNIENKGIEIVLRATPVQLRNSLRWDVSFNYARNHSKIIELAPGIESYLFANPGSAVARSLIEARVGQSFGNIVGYKYKRSPDGKRIVSDEGAYVKSDETGILGNITPKFVGGLNNSFSFKGFTLNFLIDFVQGNQILSSTKFRMLTNGTAKFTEEGREHSKPLDGVVEIKDANGNVIKYETNTKTVDGQTYWSRRGWDGIGEEFVMDGSFIMLREVILGYTLQPSLLKKTPIKSIRISLVGRNLWYIENHNQGLGISPETNLDTKAGTTGLEAYQMPTTRSYGINLGLNF